MSFPSVPTHRTSDVGRVSDWHKAAKGATSTPAAASEDRGVLMTNELKNYFTDQGLKTEVMAASFRCVEHVAALAGCDHLTIGESLATIERGKVAPLLNPPVLTGVSVN